MSTNTSALVFAIVMVFSSFVGCIDTEEEETSTATSPSSLGNVMVSTYHVAELVRAVGGDRVTVDDDNPCSDVYHGPRDFFDDDGDCEAYKLLLSSICKLFL